MLWHIVRFEFRPDVDADERVALERALQDLGDAIDEVAWLAVSRSVDEPAVTGLLTLFADSAALAAYRDHPLHVPIVERARALCSDLVRLDVTADTPD